MTDSHGPYPVRPPAPGPAIVLDLPALWAAVEDEMARRGMTEVKQLSVITGVDRTTLGRIRARAKQGVVTEGQRGGINVNAYKTLAVFARNGAADEFGRELRGGIAAYVAPDPDRYITSAEVASDDPTEH